MTKKILAAATGALLASVAIPQVSYPLTLSQTLEILAAAGVTPRDFGLTKSQYSVGEAMAHLGIGRNSLYHLIASGELVPTRFGKRTMLTAPDLARIILMRRGANLPLYIPATAGAPSIEGGV
jgi:hypothetical protein